ncbi:MAG: glutamate synthase subunit beta [Candidatus Margulisiibacteriota bacterium]
MADPKGFLKVKRNTCQTRPASERIKDYREIVILKSKTQSEEQASRCMDCGTPFCHSSCPVGNLIPEWNDEMYRGNWQKAFTALQLTNNFPEITGRICPSLCEYGCVLGYNDDPVTVRENELSIIEEAFKNGHVKPAPPKKRTGKKVAVIGSGPAGLASADQLNKYGHSVTVFEKDDQPGGILRYGIPDFKLEKHIIDRRLALLKKEGVVFKTGVDVGEEYSAKEIVSQFDAVCIAIGSRTPRDINIEGRSLGGIHFAMDYLCQSNRRISGEKVYSSPIDACGKKVLVIGGGDTGSDCVGTANRQGALSVTQIEIMPKPPVCRTEEMPWPKYPMLLKTSTSHEEGAKRQWSILTKKFEGENGTVKRVVCTNVEFVFDKDKFCQVMKEIPGSEFVIEADLIVLALGFVHPERDGIVKDLNLKLDVRGNILTGPDYMTSKKPVFAAGDSRRGASLVVWAIYEGRQAAESIDRYLSTSVTRKRK